jgi:uncharacterized protein (DUF302 family)
MHPERRVWLSVAGAGPSDRQEKAPEYDYRRETGRRFDDAVNAVEAAIAQAGFSIRVMHDIQATLAAKGFRVRPIRIYEIDSTPEVAASLSVGRTPCSIERLMPCRVNVFEDDGGTIITALRPTILCRVFPEDRLDAVAERLERLLLALVDAAA